MRKRVSCRHGRSFLDHLDAEAIADEAEEVYQQQQQLRQASNPTSTFTGNGTDALHRDTVLRRPIMGTSNASSVDASKAAQRDKALRQQAANARGNSAVNGRSASDQTPQRDNAVAAQTQQQQQQQQAKDISSSTTFGVSEDKRHAFSAFLSRVMAVVSNANPAASTSTPVDVSPQQQEPKQPVESKSESASDTSATTNEEPKQKAVPKHGQASRTPATIFVDSPQHEAEQEGLPKAESDSETTRMKGIKPQRTDPEPQESQSPARSSQQYSQQLFREAEFSDSIPDAAAQPSSGSASPAPSSAPAEDSEPLTSGRDSLREAAESDVTHPPSPTKSQSASPQSALTDTDVHTPSSQKHSTSADSPQKQTEHSSRLDQTDSGTSSPSRSDIQEKSSNFPGQASVTSSPFVSDKRNESKGTSSSSPQPQQSSKGASRDESKPDWAELPLPEDEPWYRPQPQQPPKAHTQQPQAESFPSYNPQLFATKGSAGPAPKPHWAERDAVFFATNAEGSPMNFHVDGQPEESEASLLVFEVSGKLYCTGQLVVLCMMHN